eukprot:Phypoly_transcript_09896.p1 GENE.Phypoly_transcript_09896~~Phypoly_transcript_09896.p1  ORF type:complete len:402 (+),score=9.85 Phypoly_transcript_09896:75-1280(+)
MYISAAQLQYLFIFGIFLFEVTNAQEYITNLPCISNKDCNQGSCQSNNVCKCNYMYYPNEANTIPCNTPMGHLHPKLLRGILFLWLAMISCVLITHIVVIIAFTRARKHNTPPVQHWQVDPRFTIAILWCEALICLVQFIFMYEYCFGNTKRRDWIVLNDFGRIFLFEVGASVSFFWFIAILAVTDRKKVDSYLKVPFLAIAGFCMIVWLIVGNFVVIDPHLGSSTVHNIEWFREIFMLLILAAIIVGLLYYGLKMRSMLLPSIFSTKDLVDKISKFLVGSGIVVLGTAVIQTLIVSVQFFTHPVPLLWMFLAQVIIDFVVHVDCLIIFGGGSIKRVINAFLYEFTFGRFGIEFKNDIDEVIARNNSKGKISRKFSRRAVQNKDVVKATANISVHRTHDVV